jgi:hypothetical protein
MTRRPKKQHSSDEFGRTGSSSISGLDAPMIGASSSITVDGIVERESGVTPPPPPVSGKTLVIVLAVCALVMLAVVVVFLVTTHVDWSAFRAAFTPRG